MLSTHSTNTSYYGVCHSVDGLSDLYNIRASEQTVDLLVALQKSLIGIIEVVDGINHISSREMTAHERSEFLSTAQIELCLGKREPEQRVVDILRDARDRNTELTSHEGIAKMQAYLASLVDEG